MRVQGSGFRVQGSGFRVQGVHLGCVAEDHEEVPEVSWRVTGHYTREAKVLACTGGLDVIRKEAWPFYRTISESVFVGSSRNLKDLKDVRE